MIIAQDQPAHEPRIYTANFELLLRNSWKNTVGVLITRPKALNPRPRAQQDACDHDTNRIK